jgi:hypothetical protein
LAGGYATRCAFGAARAILNALLIALNFGGFTVSLHTESARVKENYFGQKNMGNVPMPKSGVILLNSYGKVVYGAQ